MLLPLVDLLTFYPSVRATYKTGSNEGAATRINSGGALVKWTFYILKYFLVSQRNDFLMVLSCWLADSVGAPKKC